MITKARIRAAGIAFGIHLISSLAIAALAALLVLGLWFPHPLGRITGGLDLFFILIGVDIICGPLLTALLFSPTKRRRELVIDLSLVIFIQLGALIYGIYSIGQARPVAMVYEVDRFVAVPASQIDIATLPEALPELRSLSWSGPVLMGTRSARNGLETLKSIELSLQGLEPSARPGWWQSYEKSRPSVKLRMKKLNDLLAQQPSELQVDLKKSLNKIAIPINEIYYLPLVSRKSIDDWIVLLDKQANIIGHLPVGGFLE